MTEAVVAVGGVVAAYFGLKKLIGEATTSNPSQEPSNRDPSGLTDYCAQTSRYVNAQEEKPLLDSHYYGDNSPQQFGQANPGYDLENPFQLQKQNPRQCTEKQQAAPIFHQHIPLRRLPIQKREKINMESKESGDQQNENCYQNEKKSLKPIMSSRAPQMNLKFLKPLPPLGKQTKATQNELPRPGQLKQQSQLQPPISDKPEFMNIKSNTNTYKQKGGMGPALINFGAVKDSTRNDVDSTSKIDEVEIPLPRPNLKQALQKPKRSQLPLPKRPVLPQFGQEQTPAQEQHQQQIPIQKQVDLPKFQHQLPIPKRPVLPNFEQQQLLRPNQLPIQREQQPQEKQRPVLHKLPVNHATPSVKLNLGGNLIMEEKVAPPPIGNSSDKSDLPHLEGLHANNFEIKYSDLQFGDLIGEGAFGKVYKGKYRGTTVAIKQLICTQLSKEVENDFRGEVRVMSCLRHPNVILFMGACTKAPFCVVTELAERGSLWNVLHDPSIVMTQRLRLRIAIDSAKGLLYLHSLNPCVLHRDLKSGNLLVDSAFNTKLSDFGLSRVKDFTHTMTGERGTFQWMAPEVLTHNRYSEKADVFSFAVVMWEMVTRLCPYDGLNSMQVAMAVLHRDLRPEIPPTMNNTYQELMERCWSPDPNSRPSFDVILEELEVMMKSA